MRSFASSVALLAFSVAAPLSAQVRSGVTVSLGIGGGPGSLLCDVACTTKDQGALSGYLRAGAPVSPHLVLAGEVNSWSHVDQTRERVTIRYAGPVLLLYPSLTRGFFLKGGAGLGMTKLDDGVDRVDSRGFAYQVGVGYDVALVDALAVTPYLTYYRSVHARARLNGASTPFTLDGSVPQFGLALTWR